MAGWWAIKVRKKGERTWRFLTPQGGETKLWIHAAMSTDRGASDRNVAYMTANEPDYDFKVVSR